MDDLFSPALYAIKLCVEALMMSFLSDYIGFSLVRVLSVHPPDCRANHGKPLDRSLVVKFHRPYRLFATTKRLLSGMLIGNSGQE